MRQLCEWKGITIIEAEVCLDHIHMLVEIPPKYREASVSAGENNYSECYDVITTHFNRTLSQKWCWSCKQFGGTDGTNIINQLKLSSNN